MEMNKVEKFIDRLYHVCITVADIEEALAFYCGVLGLESTGSLRNEKSDGAVLGRPGEEIEIHAEHLRGTVTENATVIDLIQYITPKADETAPPQNLERMGITRMAFGVKNIDDIYETLKARGDIKFVCEPMLLNAPGGGWLKVFTFHDPFGVTLELIESGQE